MRTVLSWSELHRSLTDLRSLLAFRRGGLTARDRQRLWASAAVVVALTLLVICVPAYSGDLIPRNHFGRVVALLPSACLGVLVLTLMSAIAAGGGRELVPRDQAAAFPVSTTTDHWGAFLMAPLNIAWLLQTWMLLGATAYAFGSRAVPAYAVAMLLWVVACTAFAQLVGWLVEGVRRSQHGILVVRVLLGALAATAAGLVMSGRVTAILDHSPTAPMVFAIRGVTAGHFGPWLITCGVLLLVVVLTLLAGALVARWALLRPMREELRLESGHHQARRAARSDLAMMLRIDRASVWRSVPLRRGIFVLALMPGLVALAGRLSWEMLTIMPGLVASGAALLFGVNAWCLDGRAALWRDNLPVSPALGFLSRVIVLAELLAGSALVTLVLATLRAGRPTSAELSALVCATLVVALQVVATAMRWSVGRPYAVDLRSARATPAPPVVMAGYSARLALKTTMTGLLFSALSHANGPLPALVFAVPLLAWSALRLTQTAQQWADPVTRARVIATVAG